MTDQELRELVASIAKTQAETAKQLKETGRRMQETDRRMQETDRQIKQLGKQLGELGNKFGTFTEGMALPSMSKILRERFGVNEISPRRQSRLNSETLEVDVLAFDNTGRRNEAYVVEVKSHLKEDAIDQILQTISDVPRFFPYLKDRKIYGIIAAVYIPENLREAVIKQGLYLAQLSDDNFKLIVPRNFKPRPFGPAVSQNGKQNGRAKKKKSRTK